jgi:hypothetical protein
MSTVGDVDEEDQRGGIMTLLYPLLFGLHLEPEPDKSGANRTSARCKMQPNFNSLLTS